MIAAIALAAGMLFGEVQHAQREYQLTEPTPRYFVVSYDYTMDSYVVPATYPLGDPHYSATITIYEIVGGERVPVGKPINGQYVEKGCFEDDPEALVKRALGWKWDGRKYVMPKDEAAR